MAINPSTAADFPRKISRAFAQVKRELQRDYEQAYPALREIIHLVLDEEESKAWKLSAFPHLLFPDLVEAHITKLSIIGAAVVRELQTAGHRVLGLARSDAAAQALAKLGAEAHRGELSDTDNLVVGTQTTDGVIHLGFVHDFANYEAAIETDRRAIAALADGLEGSGKPFVATFGAVGLSVGRIATEEDTPLPLEKGGTPRGLSEALLLAAADRGVRASIVRLPPSVDGRRPWLRADAHRGRTAQRTCGLHRRREQSVGGGSLVRCGTPFPTSSREGCAASAPPRHRRRGVADASESRRRLPTAFAFRRGVSPSRRRLRIRLAVKVAQIEDNIRSREVKLSPEQLQRLDKASAVSLGFPHDFLAFDPAKAVVFGGMRDRIAANCLTTSNCWTNINAQQTAVITGGHSGIGYSCARHLASLDALLCNAGGRFDGPVAYSEDGYEVTFASNCLGHFLLTCLLAEHMVPAGRVVFTASGTHDPDTIDGKLVGAVVDPDAVVLANIGKNGSKPISAGKRYSTSKLVNILNAYELHRRLRSSGSSLVAIAFDPGSTPDTGLLRTMPKPVQWLSKTTFMTWLSRRLGVTIGSLEFSGASLARLAADPACARSSGKYLQSNDGKLIETRSSTLSYNENRPRGSGTRWKSWPDCSRRKHA